MSGVLILAPKSTPGSENHVRDLGGGGGGGGNFFFFAKSVFSLSFLMIHFIQSLLAFCLNKSSYSSLFGTGRGFAGVYGSGT